MAIETIRRIKDRLEQAPSLSEQDRREISALIDKLGEEIEALPETCREDARSLAGFTELTLHEATRAEADGNLLEIGLQGIQGAIGRLQERHPRIAAVASDIATILGGMGF